MRRSHRKLLKRRRNIYTSNVLANLQSQLRLRINQVDSCFKQNFQRYFLAKKIVKRKMKLRWRNVTMRMPEESDESSETDSEGEEEEESFDDGSEEVSRVPKVNEYSFR